MAWFRWARLLLVGLLAAPLSATAAEIAISCGAVGQELALCRQGAEDWAARTGHTVRVVSTPASATERLALYQQLLAARADDVDVFQIDVIWPGILADHLVDLSAAVDAESLAAHFPVTITAGTVEGRLVAMPWFTDAGLLYYRADLLQQYDAPVPATWEELTATAARIQAAERAAGKDGMWGYVWQGRAYEGLTCNALEWIASSGGGAIIDVEGNVTIDNPRAAAALDRAAGWVDTITPKGVLNYQEEDARALFQSGNAVFMRNWPYAWALANAPDSPVRGAVGIAPLPRAKDAAGDVQGGVLGGQQLAVSRYSQNREAAIDLVRHLTGIAEQKWRAVAGAFHPTIQALYDDPEVLAANPFFADLQPVFARAVARPSRTTGQRYNRVSTAFWNAAHGVLEGRTDGADAVARLSRSLERLRRGGRW